MDKNSQRICLIAAFFLLIWCGCGDNSSGYLYAKRAVQNDDIVELKRLIPKIDVNEREHESNPYFDGQTLLHHAVDSNSLKAAKMLLESKADPNLKNSAGRSPLMNLVRLNGPSPDRVAMLRLFLENGADVNSRNDNGNSLVHVSTGWRDLEYLEILVEFGADINTLITLATRQFRLQSSA